MKNFEKIGFILTIPYEHPNVRPNVEKKTPIAYERANVRRNANGIKRTYGGTSRTIQLTYGENSRR